MSDVLIKNMKMPTSCSVCPMLEGDSMDGLCHAASKWLDDDKHWTWYVYPEGDMDDSKPCNCPLVPVPPHGRLIDANELMEMIRRAKEDDSETADVYEDDYHIVDEWLSVAPTVIPADREMDT